MFPAHYSDTAKAVLSIPGWRMVDLPGEYVEGAWYIHDNGSAAFVYLDGTIDTFPAA